MNSKITIELKDASWIDADVLRMMISSAAKKCVEDFNAQNGRDVQLIATNYDHPALHVNHMAMKPLHQQLEERANELYPENIIKKKDKSKPLKKAYIDGGLAACDILSKAYADGVLVEEIF